MFGYIISGFVIIKMGSLLEHEYFASPRFENNKSLLILCLQYAWTLKNDFMMLKDKS